MAAPNPRFGRRAIISMAALTAIAAAALAGGLLLRRGDRLPAPESPAYETFVHAFYHGLAALEVGLLDDAKSQFEQDTAAVPGEPAAWTNLGVTELRRGDFNDAAIAVSRAVALAPESGAVALVQGQLEAARGHSDDAVMHLRRAVDLDPGNVRARYALADQLESSGRPDADLEATRLIETLIDARPANLALLLERGRLATKRADATRLRDSQDRLAARSSAWPAAATEQLQLVERAAAAQNFQDAARALVMLRNVLAREREYRDGLAEIKTPTELMAEPLERLLRLPSPPSVPSPFDPGLAFTASELPGPLQADLTFAVSLDGVADPALFAIDGHELRRLDGAAASWPLGVEAGPLASSVARLDWNNDFKTDLAVAGREGVRLLVQNGAGGFDDVTAAAGRGVESAANCIGVWAADIEMDGDLDLIVGVGDGNPLVLRNNGDGTWLPLHPFADIVGAVDCAWADIDGDGDPDAALLDAGGVVHLFENRQGGVFAAAAHPPAASGRILALGVGDLNGDGRFDLVTLDASGSLHRSALVGGAWVEENVAVWPELATAARGADAPAGSYRLMLADMDNNGAVDLVASGAAGSGVWLADAARVFHALSGVPAMNITALSDLNRDGQRDLTGTAAGRAVRMLGRGTKGYHWQVLRPRAQPAAGDQRINSFGIGGEVEIRSGLLTQKQIIDGDIVQLGLGVYRGVDVVRIVWPNGSVQADFDTGGDRAIVVAQRLKGSCPWVFAYDGKTIRFVTDFLWRSPLGLRINAQDTAGVTQTEDWVKIGGAQLKPTAGDYDVRITAELWETHFIDRVSLLAVDHPADLEVFVDERFSNRPPALAPLVMRQPQAVARATDQAGRDVTDLVARRDGRYLATFDRGRYQGVAQDHFVELDLGRSIASGGRWLVANGWIYPTDSSINVAIGQGTGNQAISPHGLSLEARDRSGHWVVVEPDLGFPAGKNKTILIDLSRIARAGLEGARVLRLRTNLEIYWDWIAVAKPADPSGAVVKTSRLEPKVADLRYRGFSQTDYQQRDRPELPDYNVIANISQRWRDLVGYYTRVGDVRELLAGVDDRYVIMNAGDELRLRFSAEAPPPSGWTRDFVLIGDGWVKDGDFNTSASQTVLPLPAHDRSVYESPPRIPVLEEDPVFRRHPSDWESYHTRFIAPDRFLKGLQ